MPTFLENDYSPFILKVSLQGNSSSTPVNRVPEPPPKQFECVLKRKEQPIITGLNDEKKAATEQPPQEPSGEGKCTVKILSI
jgi:hypothetical protein